MFSQEPPKETFLNHKHRLWFIITIFSIENGKYKMFQWAMHSECTRPSTFQVRWDNNFQSSICSNVSSSKKGMLSRSVLLQNINVIKITFWLVWNTLLHRQNKHVHDWPVVRPSHVLRADIPQSVHVVSKTLF